MATTFKTPGVYVQEISKLPPSVAQVETAIPAFIGYTEKATAQGRSLLNEAVRISSLEDYVAVFGGPFSEHGKMGTITIEEQDGRMTLTTPPSTPAILYRMFYGMQLFFANGGGPCYIISVGLYDSAATAAIDEGKLLAGLAVLKKEDEPTLIVFPDAIAMSDRVKFHNVYAQALQQSADLQDRFVLCDIFNGSKDFLEPGGENVINDPTLGFRTKIGNNNLTYGAAYYPWLKTTLSPFFDETELLITETGGSINWKMFVEPDPDATDDPTKESLFHQNNNIYHQIKNIIGAFNIVLAPSSIMAGVYARVDAARGVWKAPANVGVTSILEPTVVIDDEAQDLLNVDSSGKSVNAIRFFTGRGLLVWGARTLAGNDNEWRYVPVRRFFLMAEESIKKAAEQFVFEPNDANTWIKVRGMIENFLLNQWRAGALQGAKPEQAFFVRVGLGETMNALDILEGRMNVEIGMAVVRPAEFIILKFSQKLAEA